MAHKTFISYKYSEARNLRDKIIEALGANASYYRGETSISPNMSDLRTETIKKNLADMMYDTTVTIIIISPKIKESNWMEWEIKYCLREKTRKGRTSKRNGLVGVIMKVDDSYDWFKTIVENSDGCKTCTYDNTILHDIIRNNRFNQVPKVYSCNICKSVDKLTGSYISLIEEDDFFYDPEKYINNAYDKSENDALGYNIIQD